MRRPATTSPSSRSDTPEPHLLIRTSPAARYDTRMRPATTDYAPYYDRYVSLVQGDDVLTALEQQSAESQKILASLDETRADYRYEEGKWSVKEVVGHMLDSERVFSYRALAFARGDAGPLPGFDQQVWADSSSYDRWSVPDLGEEYALLRRSNVVMFRNFSPDAWERRGVASDNEVTVNALVWIIAGHELHHLGVLRSKYLV